MFAPKYRVLLDGLAKAGFKTNLGLHGTGAYQLLLLRGGGIYIGQSLMKAVVSILTPVTDVGTSKHIVNGDIKVKSGSAIERFTETGLKFEDGTELEADIVVIATG